MTKNSGYLSMRELAETLNLPYRTVTRMAQRGDVPRHVVLAGRRRWRPEDVDEWVAERTVESQPFNSNK